VSGEGLQLTVHLGERDRAGDGFLADALIDACARRGVRASCLLRGIEGFGAHHRLATERLLTLSEDLPVVCVAVGARATIEALAHDVRALQPRGLVTLARVQLLDGDGASASAAQAVAPGDASPSAEARLTVHLGRQQRATDGRLAYLAVVDALHDAGVAGASVLLGVDGTADGERRRARVAGSNAHVPLLVVSVGARTAIAAALRRLASQLPDLLATLERVQVCKRDGVLLSPPAPIGDPAAWGRLSVYASEQSRHRGATLHSALVRRLRAEGAPGATALRGIWGYHGDHAPHGDRFWALRRRVPVIATVVDRGPAIARWFQIVDELTDATGLVTSERVPAWSAGGPPPTPRR
jgi:PII-like signaling protein